jgi:uncharacterized protein
MIRSDRIGSWSRSIARFPTVARCRLAAVVLAFVAILVCVGATSAEPTFPALTGRIVDQAGILDPAARARIEAKLQELESKTSTQLVVVTLIGQKGQNNGALLIVAPSERRVRIEVGYGLEGTLTDAVSNLIIQNAILPRFRVGDFSGGIERGADDVVQVLSGDADDFKRRAAERRQPQEGISLFPIVLLILFLWLFFYFRQTRRQQVAGRRQPGSWGPVIIPGGGGFGGGFGDGGGFGGGGGGGFGGGGGSFGGGGSSGSW